MRNGQKPQIFKCVGAVQNINLGQNAFTAVYLVPKYNFRIPRENEFPKKVFLLHPNTHPIYIHVWTYIIYIYTHIRIWEAYFFKSVKRAHSFLSLEKYTLIRLLNQHSYHLIYYPDRHELIDKVIKSNILKCDFHWYWTNYWSMSDQNLTGPIRDYILYTLSNDLWIMKIDRSVLEKWRNKPT